MKDNIYISTLYSLPQQSTEKREIAGGQVVCVVGHSGVAQGGLKLIFSEGKSKQQSDYLWQQNNKHNQIL